MNRIQRTGIARGFTLLEIIVVVTIIALLASLITPRLLVHIDKSKVAVAQAEVNTIAREVSLYLIDSGQATPTDDFELALLTSGDQAALKSSDLIDPWANDYDMLVPGETDPAFNVVSYGSDGQTGGDGYAADILND